MPRRARRGLVSSQFGEWLQRRGRRRRGGARLAGRGAEVTRGLAHGPPRLLNGGPGAGRRRSAYSASGRGVWRRTSSPVTVKHYIIIQHTQYYQSVSIHRNIIGCKAQRQLIVLQGHVRARRRLGDK